MKIENPIYRSLELIENRISEKLNVEIIANSVYFSKFHYQRLFREVVGDSVMEYVTKRKLTLAGRALLETGASILDIALDYGYDSRDSFARSFKAYMGVTPTDYRKYGLAAIKQKTVKERLTMTYSKTTDEILRELNEFIAKAKETAATARKCEIPWYKEFWGSIADRTDKMTDDLRRTLTRVSDIADHPDKITSHFNIISAIDDAAFFSNIIAFHAGLTISRGQPENYKAMWPLCERYRDLAMMLVKKIFKIQQFLKELSALIFEDMRKTVAAKLTDASQKAKSAADMIQGYDYIKSELLNLLDALNTKSDVTEKDLEMLLFRLKIIELPAETDMLRNKNRTMLDGMEPLRKSLEEARDFVLSLPKPQKDEPVNIIDILQNIAYQGNILLFYTRGEIEKLDISLTAEQKAATERICVSISEFVKLTQNAADSTAFRQIAGVMREVKNDMRILADTLSDHGGAFSFLCGELESFDGKMLACADDYDKKNAAV